MGKHMHACIRSMHLAVFFFFFGHLVIFSASRTMSVALKSNENYFNFEEHIKTPDSVELCPTC